MLQRNMFLAGLHLHRLRLSLPGNLDLTVGALVFCHIPVATGHTDPEKLLDATYSGVYLITAVHHKLDRQKHVSLIEVMKDSRIGPLPAVDPQLIKIGVS